LCARIRYPLRPAHFIFDDFGGAIRQRKDHAFQNLAVVLPQATRLSEDTTAPEKVQVGVAEWIRRLGKTSAFSYARGLFHAAPSPSNMDILGRALDFGSFTGLRGYARAKMLAETQSFGDTADVIETIVEFVKSLHKNLGRNSVATVQEAKEAFEDEYQSSLKLEFARLTGIPDEILVEIDSSLVNSLGSLLLEIARHGNTDIIDASSQTPPHTGTYDLRKILQILAKNLQKIPAPLQNQVSSFFGESILEFNLPVADADLRRQLVRKYLHFVRAAEEISRKKGISTSALRTYMIHAQKQRNKRIPELFRGSTFWEHFSPLITEYSNSGKTEAIWNAIDQWIARGRRTFRDNAPYTLVLREEVDSAVNVAHREIFDLKIGQIRHVQIDLISKDKTANPSELQCSRLAI
jgi:hypothetical protein